MSGRQLKQPTRIALLGCGTVGSEVARQLLGGRLGHVELVKILVRRAELDRGLPRHLFTNTLEDVFESQPDIIIELIGGLDPAAALTRACLTRARPVITANKTVIAHHGPQLTALARSRSTTLSYNAAVGASLPLLAALSRLRADRVLSIRAVINGTCNFILTQMAATGCTLPSAIAQAQSLGLAEPDPAADIGGRDSAEKLVVLARHAGLPGVDLASVAVNGIANITAQDHRDARAQGCVIKLLAEFESEPSNDGAAGDSMPRPAFLRVGPTLLPLSHPLAKLTAEENAALITAELAGDIFLKGKGAGPRPSASAILGDICELAPHRCDDLTTPVPSSTPSPAAAPSNPARRRHVVRITAPPSSLSVDRVLQASRAATLDELALSRGRARLLTAPTCDHTARIIAARLGTETLTLPILEHSPAK